MTVCIEHSNKGSKRKNEIICLLGRLLKTILEMTYIIGFLLFMWRNIVWKKVFF
jgi:hypothetical protein